jgi:hypothetical protein
MIHSSKPSFDASVQFNKEDECGIDDKMYDISPTGSIIGKLIKHKSIDQRSAFPECLEAIIDINQYIGDLEEQLDK